MVIAYTVYANAPDSGIFGGSNGVGGGRDNFFITVFLGSMSKEAKQMIFPGCDLEDRVYSVGEGIAKIDGKGIVYIKYPKIRDIKKLENEILEGLAKQNGETA